MTTYKVAEHLADGGLYVVVTMNDGSTFGQIIGPAEVADVDRKVANAVALKEAETEAIAARPAIGTQREVVDDRAARQA